MIAKVTGHPLWKRLFCWQTLLILFATCETLAIATRHYDPLYIERLWPQISLPLTIALAAIVLCKPDMRSRPGMRWMLLYFLWYLAVLIVNRWFLAYEFRDFQLTLYRLLFTTLVCFPMGCLLSEDARRKAARAVFCTITSAFALLGALGSYCVIAQTRIYTPYGHGSIGLGLEQSTGIRLYLFSHPNIAGAALAMTLLLTLYLLLTARSRTARIGHALCCLTQFLALSLTLSRTSMLGASVGIALLPFLIVWDKTRDSRPRIAWLLSLISAAAAVALAMACMNLIVWGTGQIAQMDIPAASEQTAEENAAAEQADTPAEADTSDPSLAQDMSAPTQRGMFDHLLQAGGRSSIWATGLRTLASYPTLLLKGATLERLMVTVNARAPEGKEYVHLHSSYLTVLIGLGLPGVLLLIGFLFLLARSSLRLVYCRDGSVGLGERFLPGIFLASLVIAGMEPFFFTGEYFMDRLFYILAGFVVATAHSKLKRLTHSAT